MHISINFRLRTTTSKRRLDGSRTFKVLENKESMIYCSVSVNSEPRVDFSTKLKVLPSNWSQDFQIVNPKSEGADYINGCLQVIKNDLKENFARMQRLNEPITTHILVRSYSDNKSDIPTMMDVWAEYLSELKETVNIIDGIEQHTYNKWEDAKNHFQNFITFHFKRADLRIPEVSQELAPVFYKYMRSLKNNKKENISPDHAARVVYSTKAVLEHAVSKNYIPKNTWKEQKFSREPRVKKVYLTEHQVEKLYNYDICSPTERNIIDIFVFNCYTGLSFSDYLELSKKHLTNHENGYEILIHRFKNRKHDNQIECCIPLLPIAQEILEKYDFHLPKFPNQTMNKYIKIISERLRFPHFEDITTHVARKTAGTFYLNNGVRIEIVAKILGHKDIRTTQKHYAWVLKDTVREETAHLRKVGLKNEDKS